MYFQMLLSQDLYCNVFCVHDYHKTSVTYIFLWILCRTIVSIHENVRVRKSSQVLVRLDKTMYVLPESYRRKNRKKQC